MKKIKIFKLKFSPVGIGCLSKDFTLIESNENLYGCHYIIYGKSRSLLNAEWKKKSRQKKSKMLFYKIMYLIIREHSFLQKLLEGIFSQLF